MKFKVDENLPAEAAAILRESGHDADTIWDETLSGATDELLATTVRREERILLTLDLDFSNIQAYPPDQHPGIIVLRPKTQNKATVLSLIRRIVPVCRAEVRLVNYGSSKTIASGTGRRDDCSHGGRSGPACTRRWRPTRSCGTSRSGEPGSVSGEVIRHSRREVR